MTDWNQRLIAADLPEAVLARVTNELGRSQENETDRADIDRWVETILTVPWTKRSTSNPIDVVAARALLNERHVGLERVKRHVLEEVAVRALAPDAPQPMLFFVGPPYTGKSHVAQTIATIFDRPFIRLSLAGATRESDVRGRGRGSAHPHPGLFVDALIGVGVCDPIIYLDEADKLKASEGDPMDALLAAIDDERNQSFLDRYLGVPIDLSRAMIIMASQGESLAPALASRVTYVEFPGYTTHEKEEISRRFLLPAQIAAFELEDHFRVSDRALRDVIEGWTYEPGVGRLEARINVLARAAALRIVDDGVAEVLIDSEHLEEILGPRPLDIRAVDETDRIGVVNGLVMNSIEGAITIVEAFTYHGREDFFVTGSVGTVMRESCRVAWTVVRRNSGTHWDLSPTIFKSQSLHLHFPKGAIDKEGPSAGIAIATAIFSRFSGIPVHHDIAMTGELSLDGRVLRIGGLKKKILGAHRAGVRVVIIPLENAPDLIDIPAEVLGDLEIVTVSWFDEVLSRALLRLPDDLPSPTPVTDTGTAREPVEFHEPREPQAGAVTPPSETAVDEPAVARSGGRRRQA